MGQLKTSTLPMAKRKSKRDDEDRMDEDSDGGGSESGSDGGIVDVSFEFFDPNPKVDYQAIKSLATQLFGGDAPLISPGTLSDLILSQPLLGTTIKTDGMESDPLAVLSVLNMEVHRENEAIKALRSYILGKVEDRRVRAVLEGTEHVGFVFSERLVNMPVQVVPPMYRMLADEIQWANDEAEPYTFTSYLFVTRTYRLDEAQVEELEERSKQQRPAKKRKAKTNTHGGEEQLSAGTYSYHPEDEIIQKFSIATIDYDLTNRQPRGEDAFGMDVAGRIMLVPADKFKPMIESMSETFAAPSS